MENGIVLGGVWRDFQMKEEELKVENARLVARNIELEKEKLDLETGHSDLLLQFRSSASCLTREHSSHLAALAPAFSSCPNARAHCQQISLPQRARQTGAQTRSPMTRGRPST